MDNALAFVPSGANLLEAVRGDLTGNGVDDQLLVIDQPAPDGLVPGEHGPNRVLLLLLGDAAGRWQLAARNDKLVPCSTRGGIAGDPFAYVTIEDGAFSVITNGGSRERWSSVTPSAMHPPSRPVCMACSGWSTPRPRPPIRAISRWPNLAGCGSRISIRPSSPT